MLEQQGSSGSQAMIDIIAAPVACESGFKDSWRDVAGWLSQQLYQRFGEAVRVRYFNLFDPDCPALPPEAQLPLVLLDGAVLSTGTKISLPAVRRALETAGVQQANT